MRPHADRIKVLASRRPSTSWGSRTSAEHPERASSSSRGSPDRIADRRSSRRSRRDLASNASAHPGSGALAEAGRNRTLQLLCGSNQRQGAFGVPALGGRSMAAHAPAAQSERWLHLESHSEVGRRLASRTTHPSSLAEPTLCRQTPEVGAQCPNWARWDLSGRRSARSVPTGMAYLRGDFQARTI